jgi:hypothetical protein
MIEPEIAVLVLAHEEARREVINHRYKETKHSQMELDDAAEEWFNANRKPLIADVRKRYASVINTLIKAKQRQKAK